MTNPPPPPGWYPHPSMANTQRYWDGESWSDHIAPGMPGVGQLHQQTPPDDTLMIVAGFATAALIPIVGFVLGCILVGRKPAVGAGIIALSLVMGLVYFQYFASQSYYF